LARAFAIGTPLAFGTDVTYYREGKTRGDLSLDYVQTFVDAGIPAADILRIMTVKAARAIGVETRRGVLKDGFAADIIAVTASPLSDVQALRQVSFVMKDGVVYKREGRFTWDTPRKIGR
jgi:imidazolonepropionase-like amidohydrolase